MLENNKESKPVRLFNTISTDITLDDGTKLTKSSDNKSMIIEKDDKEIFNITSSTPYHFVGDITKTNEWGYKEAGYEILKCEKECIIKGNYICNPDYVTKGKGSLAEQKTYTSCVYYPQQIEVKEIEGKNETFYHRNFTKLSKDFVRIDFADERIWNPIALIAYDPTLSNLTIGLQNCWSLDNFTDSVDSATLTNVGGVEVNNTEFKLGTGSMTFNASNSRYLENTSLNSEMGPTHTFAFWAYPNSPANNAFLVNFRPNNQIAFAVTNDRTPKMRYRIGVFFEVTGGAGDRLTNNAWSLVVLTSNGTNDRRLYINNLGVVLNDTDNITAVWSGFDEVRIGSNGEDFGFIGNIDNVVWWNVAFNASKVLELYNNSAGLSCQEIISSGEDESPPDVPPGFTILPTNISTTNISSIITWTNSKATNFTINYSVCPSYSGSNISNSTSIAFHNPLIIDLENSTNYCFNITVQDSTGNLNFSLFNFTTEANVDVDDTTNPTYTNFQNNASDSGTSSIVNWSVVLADETQLDAFRFAHNQSGTLTNVTIVDISGTSFNADYNLTITLTSGESICGQFWFNDTSGNTNNTNLSCFTVETILPIISNLINASTKNESSNVTWTTDENANYTIILYNNTERNSTFLVHQVFNDTFSQSFNQNFSNLLNSTTYFINLTACDSSGNCADNNTFNFTTAITGVSGTSNPTYANFQNNASDTGTGDNVNFSIDLADNVQLNVYRFAHNQSGTLTNGSDVSISGTSFSITEELAITLFSGDNICGQFWFNDTSGNENQTNLTCFTVESTSPVISNVANIPFSDTSATITWTTNELANTTVDYGIVSGSLNQISEIDNSVTGHSRSLTDLDRLTTYFYTVTSCDPSGNCATSSETSFVTIAVTGRTSNLLRSGVAVLLAVAILSVFMLPLLTKTELSVGLIITMIVVFILGIVALSFIFSIT